MVAVNASGKVIETGTCATSIPAIVVLLEKVPRPRALTFEEGPLAGWLARNLAPYVDRLVVCEPRRNRLIANDGDKDDPLDAEKLSQLFRGGYIKEVHQPQTLDRAVLKQHVSFYHDHVRDRVRLGHQIVAQLRRHGVIARIKQLADNDERERILKQLPRRQVLRQDFDLLWERYLLLLKQEDQLRDDLIRLAQKEPQVKRFTALPGIGWVRAITFWVYIDTPERFRKRSALWRYCGIGLERRRSGDGPTRIRVTKGGNRHLKDLLLGAAKSAIAAGDNPFADKYQAWIEKGTKRSDARRNVARALAGVLWSMWKSGSAYDADRVR
jgi:transposase